MRDGVFAGSAKAQLSRKRRMAANRSAHPSTDALAEMQIARE
jgi:hypothetical protein